MAAPAFATPNSSSGLSWDSGSQAIFKRLADSARSSGYGTKVVLSIGKVGLLCCQYYFLPNALVYQVDGEDVTGSAKLVQLLPIKQSFITLLRTALGKNSSFKHRD